MTPYPNNSAAPTTSTPNLPIPVRANKPFLTSASPPASSAVAAIRKAHTVRKRTPESSHQPEFEPGFLAHAVLGPGRLPHQPDPHIVDSGHGGDRVLDLARHARR